MCRRYRVKTRRPGEGVYWHVIDSTMPKARGQVFAIGLSRRDAFKIAAALNTMETADKPTHDMPRKAANMKLSGVDKLFMETRNEELCALRKNASRSKLFLLQVQEVVECADCSDSDKIASVRVLVSEQIRERAAKTAEAKPQ